jgi:antitoxin component YwqK of YwqJK toxin-antitoxin module
MKLVGKLLILLIASFPLRMDAGNPAGFGVSSPSIFIPAKYINTFFRCTEPDSARLFLTKTLPVLTTNIDSTSLLYKLIKKKATISNKSTVEDYQFLISGLIELGYATNFRLYYKNSTGQIIKWKEYKPDGTLQQELALVDPLKRLLEQTTFYRSGSIMTQTGFSDTTAKIPFEWYSSGYKLVKTGKQTAFFHDGKIKSILRYTAGKLNDTSIVYNRFGEILYSEVWKNDSVINRITNKNIAKIIQAAGSVNDPATADNKRKALLIGIDAHSYKDASAWKVIDSTAYQFLDLGGCKNDVSIIRNALIRQRKFSANNIQSITDDSATKQRILASFTRFINSLKKGDIVFIHFSGNGLSLPKKANDPGSKLDFAFVCRDVNMARYQKDHDGYLRKYELDSLFGKINKAIGKEGQMILSMDACHSGDFSQNARKDTLEKSREQAFRGETSNLLFNFIKKDDASVAVFTATAANEFAFETSDDEGKLYGIYSYNLAAGLLNPGIGNTRELYDEITGLGEEKNSKQHPAYFANFDMPLFETEILPADSSQAVLPIFKQSGNAFVISAGISQYASSASNKLKFSNCTKDAAAYASFFQSQFSDVEGGRVMRSWLLTDSAATKQAILKAINETISNSKPEDYFIFNFSGYCKPLSDSTGKKVTYFVPYGLKNIADTSEIKTKGIPLSQLKDLLQLIPANNQLFITEAGSTDAFQKEFIQALIETSPTIAALSNKNRIFMVPRSSGLDKFNCNNIPVDHGPLNYYITNLTSDLNFFGLFENAVYANAVKYAISKTEVSCDYFKSGYFDIFFEKDYIKDLEYFLPQEVMQSRGVIGTMQARDALAAANSKRYALVMGTNKYDGKPDWNDLNNAVLDAEDIARELTEGFGYSTKLLIDKPVDSFYAHIAYLSQVLNKNDQLIIYVAGHGDFDSVLLDDGFIVCKNSKPPKEDPYRNTYIQHSKLEKMVNRLPANQILMVLDVCFGGTFDERVAKNEVRSKTTIYDDISDKAFFAKMLMKKTRLYLTSGGKDVVPDGFNGKHSPFAIKLLGILQARGGSSKTLITATALKKVVEKLQSGPLLGSFGDDAGNSDFILVGN